MTEAYAFIVGSLTTLLAVILIGRFRGDRQLWSLWDDGHDPHPWAAECAVDGCLPVDDTEVRAILAWDNGHSKTAEAPPGIEATLEKRETDKDEPTATTVTMFGVPPDADAVGGTFRYSLHTADPRLNEGTEVASTTGYPRQPVTWSAAETGVTTLTHLSFFDARRPPHYTAAEYLEHWRELGVDPWETE